MPEPAASFVRPPVPARELRRVDLICDAFERGWRESPAPRIESCLADVDASLAPVLRDELIRVELECRFRRGDPPAADDYRARFPECAGSLDEWLREAETAAGLTSTVESLPGRASTADHIPAAPPMAEAPPGALPQVLGEYELLGPLGAGGMGEVYRARHRRLGKLVAVKVLPAAKFSAAARARFRREAEAVGQLDHPHLVEAHDAGEQDGILYLVLKLIDGVDLHRLVRERGPRPPGEACELVRQAALGLQYLHERGLVHRDVKPSNLMRTTRPAAGREAPCAIVKVLDLGLARWQSTGEASGELTAPDMVVGTPDYLAPEQINNSAGVDIRADLYGLGATLFYLLTGRAPFAHHRDVLAKLKAHGDEAPPDVRSLRPEVPGDVAAVVARLLAKRPEPRYATPQELADALAPLATPLGPPGCEWSAGSGWPTWRPRSRRGRVRPCARASKGMTSRRVISTRPPSRRIGKPWRSASRCWASSTPTPPPATTTWPPVWAARASTPRPCPCSTRPWPSASRCWASSTPTPPPASTTWPPA